MLPRSLSPLEAAVLSAVIERCEPASAAALIRQAERAVVTGGCDCGCATINLEVARDDTDAVQLDSGVLAGDVRFVDRSGEQVGGIVVFVEDGYLSCLEFYTYGEPITEIPRVEDLRF